MSPALAIRAAASILTTEKSRKAIGWVLVAVLSPIILLLVFFCALLSGGAEHNRTAADLCFHGGAIPEGTPAEYRAYIEEMRDNFALLDAAMQTVEGQMEDGDTLDD
ncbi:MAG TPA: M23 family peptidase, partial [Candidatus Flavonifractor avistercoris]|nr:M23 family peptidase [Candidatus Flavonifractor avistercoris]